MTSYAQRKDHPLHSEWLEYRRQWERSEVRRRNRKKRYDANPEKYRLRARNYQRAHRERHSMLAKEWYRQNARVTARGLRLEMIAAYGGECACCGEATPLFLTIDHINNDGMQDEIAKRNINGKWSRRGGAALYAKLKAIGWPKDRYQLLCYNCNMGKRDNGGICPHHNKQESVA